MKNCRVKCMKRSLSLLKNTLLVTGFSMSIALPGVSYAEDYAEIANEVIPAYFATEKGKCLTVLVETLAESGSVPRDMPYTVFFHNTKG